MDDGRLVRYEGEIEWAWNSWELIEERAAQIVRETPGVVSALLVEVERYKTFLKDGKNV